MRIDKRMYGLKQAGIISNNELQKDLKPYEYASVRRNLVLWERKGRYTMFTLVVYNSLVKIISEEYEQHLINAMKENTKLP